MKKNYIIIGLIFLLMNIVSADTGSRLQFFYMNGNKLKLSLTNEGKVAAGGGLAAEWPIGSGHEYLDNFAPFFILGGQTPQIIIWDTDNSSGAPFLNDSPQSWPSSWQDEWQGYKGAGVNNADLEYYLATGNSAKNLELTMRVWQWNHYQAQDFVIVYFELLNKSSVDYDDLALGIFANPNVGGESSLDNIAISENEIFIIDDDDQGRGAGIAEGIGAWNKVGQLSFSFLELPELNHDGIDNDGDGMTDESRFDGIDNDNDWSNVTDDVGADGIAGTSDAGEGDGAPTLGEPNFDITDWDEAEQAEIYSFKILNDKNIDLINASTLWNHASSGNRDNQTSGNSFISGVKPFSILAGETKRVALAIVVSSNERDRESNSNLLGQIKSKDYSFSLAPPAPKVNFVAKDEEIILYWDKEAETWPGFEGYKIFKSSDPGFNDVFTVTDDHGNIIYHDPEETFDLKNEIMDMFPLHYNGFRYYLGKDAGLKHQWIDQNVENGKTYYYAVVAYTHGDEEEKDYPAESMKRFLALPNGEIISYDNTVIAVPFVESLGFEDESVTISHESGVSTAKVSIDIIDRSLVQNNAKYEITFDDTTHGFTTYTITDITDEQLPEVLIEDSDNFSFDNDLDENDPLINGMHIFLFDAPLEWDSSAASTKWSTGNSNWDIQLQINTNLGPVTPVPSDYEIRFAEMGVDTALFTTPIPIPFEVWNVTNEGNSYKENLLIIDQNGDGEWSSGELIYIVEGTTIEDFPPIYWTIILTAPADSNITSVPPVSGDKAQIKTIKPFAVSDKYIVETTAFSVKGKLENSDLDKIAVVPNPYVIHTEYEQKSMYTGGNPERKIQFINLPEECVIRIFDLRGRLLRKIEHNSPIEKGIEFWDLKTTEGETVAYGIYIFHIEAPEIGEMIGRFGIIR
ncbi:MAG: hypothetical protein K8R79_01375 [Calditrichales bacterium]|nr:hypothetical protein [Calditrichales bacterium]